ncbi:hypothetical protein AYI68_g2928 [Smittium mucronatum]|uniref:Uncharacterized protein n=1 Tax=Smittium mucronatum TaxID=133383 RepID=A0A1R0H1D4_9FUNG|nr:hypothetical protein AYI68_g2928 [Smittium mucronatum]
MDTSSSNISQRGTLVGEKVKPASKIHKATFRVKEQDGSFVKLSDQQTSQPPPPEHVDLCILFVEFVVPPSQNTKRNPFLLDVNKDENKTLNQIGRRKSGFYIWCGIKPNSQAGGSGLSSFNSCSLSIPRGSNNSKSAMSELSTSLLQSNTDDAELAIGKRIARMTHSAIIFSSDSVSLGLKLQHPAKLDGEKQSSFKDFQAASLVVERCIHMELQFMGCIAKNE